MKHVLTVLACVLTAVLTVSAADVAGTWNVTGDVVGNAVNFACTLTQEGEALTGTATFENREGTVPVKGTTKDGAVTFEFDVDGYNLVFAGTLGEDGAITGTIEVSGAQGTFTAKKP